LIVILFAIIENWDLLTILFIYWCQSVIIGIFHFFKILNLKNFSTKGVLLNSRPVQSNERTKRSMAIFFLFHYNFFHFGYFIFLFVSPLFRTSSNFSFQDFFVISAIFLFLITHFHSYKHNRESDSNKKQNIGKVFFSPYIRIIPMHITIIFGGFLFMSGSPPITTLVLFLLLKTVADVAMHIVEHREKLASNLKIILEKTNFIPGEIIKGSISLTFDKPKKARAFKIEFVAEKVVTQRSSDGPTQHNFEIHKSEKILGGEKEYTFENHNFEFEIPSDILIKLQNWKEIGRHAKAYKLLDSLGLAKLAILNESNNFYIKATLDIPLGMDISNTEEIQIS